MFANTRFGDFPHYLPARKWANKDELFTGWMLLSYRKPSTSSSVQSTGSPLLRVGVNRLNRLLLEEAYPREIAKSHTFKAVNVTDENPRTFWVAQSNKAGEWLTIDLQGQYAVKALQVNYTDYKSNIFKSDSTVYTQFRMYSSTDAQKWT